MSAPPIPKGTPIPCLDCGATVYVAARDINDGDAIVAALFTNADGSAVHDGDAIRCPVCRSGRVKWISGHVV